MYSTGHDGLSTFKIYVALKAMFRTDYHFILLRMELHEL